MLSISGLGPKKLSAFISCTLEPFIASSGCSERLCDKLNYPERLGIDALLMVLTVHPSFPECQTHEQIHLDSTSKTIR